MTRTNSSLHRRPSDRRSRIDRRWIKSRYQGEERRSGKDRRKKIEYKGLDKGLPVPEDSGTQKNIRLEKLLASNTIQLEAVIRLLLEKGVIEENELLTMMKMVQTEYKQQIKF